MARPKKPRKSSDEGIPKTLYLRRGTVKRAEREARKEETSVSALVDQLLADEFARRDAAAA